MNIRLLFLVVAILSTSLFSRKADSQDKDESPFAKWENAIQKFEADDKKNPKQAGQVLFIGSSSIRLWDLKKWFPDLDAINRGFGGSEVADSVHFYDRIVKPYRPRTIVMYAGDNDIAHGKTPEAVSADFQEFVAKVHKDFPDTNIVYVAVKPSIARWKMIEQVRETNDLITALAEKDLLVTFLDIDTPMIGEDKNPKPELFIADGLHLSKAGYKIWSDLLEPHLETDRVLDARFQPQRNLRDAYHPWVPPTTLKDWEVESAKIRRQVLVSNGLWPMPKKTPLEPVIHGKIDRGDYTVEKVFFRSRPGHYVTGNLYRPKKIKGKIPGILSPHGHWKDGRFYDAGTGAKAQLESGGEQFDSGAHFPLQARMVQLVRMGTVVFHYDMIGYADNQPLDHRTGFNDAQAALQLHNLMGLQTWSSIRSLDFLESLPEVDPKRLAVTGASGGGTQTMILGAVDPRVAVAFPAVMVSTGMQGGCVCENASYLRQGVNNVTFAALFAPKPQAMSGADDWTVAIETKGLPELKQIYSLYGQADLVEAHAFPQFKHNYNQVSRQVMYNWFNEHLQLGIEGPIEQTDFKPLTKEEMSVFNKEHPLPEDALKADALRKLMVQEDQEELDTWLSGDIDSYRNIVGDATQVMLNPDVPETILSSELVAEKIDYTTVRFLDGGVEIPIVVIGKQSAKSRIVFWFDSAGLSHVIDKKGKITPEVQTLVDAGYAVVSADLFFTGESKGTGSTPYHFPVNDKYPGYTYCYNQPLITERVRDILAVVNPGFRQLEERVLVGTGDAGVWCLLANSVMPENLITRTVVDLNGFSFSTVDSIDDPNLLPGALKYGGLPGLSRLISPAPLTIYGAAETDDFKKAMGHFKNELKVTPGDLDDYGVVREILKIK